MLDIPMCLAREPIAFANGGFFQSGSLAASDGLLHTLLRKSVITTRKGLVGRLLAATPIQVEASPPMPHALLSITGWIGMDEGRLEEVEPPAFPKNPTMWCLGFVGYFVIQVFFISLSSATPFSRIDCFLPGKIWSPVLGVLQSQTSAKTFSKEVRPSISAPGLWILLSSL